MTEEVQTQSQEPATSNEPETLEQVYEKFSVDDAASSFRPTQPQPQVPQYTAPAPSAPNVPDPVLDPTGYRNWAAQQENVMRQSLSHLNETVGAIQARIIRQAEEADIKAAVSTVKSKGVDLEDDAIEIALGVKARQDPRFMQLYQNRDKNPRAWNAALGAVAGEIKSKFQFRQDSQLTENVRAAKQSTSQTTKEQPSENSLERRLAEAKSPKEFDAIWARAVSGGY